MWDQAGAGVEDYVEFLVEDPDTTVIGVFVEGFRRPERLRAVGLPRSRASAARASSRSRSAAPRTPGRRCWRTGSLAGTPQIVEALLRQCGIVQVGTLNEMVDTVTLLAAARRVSRPRWLTVVVSGLGGECGRAADAADRAGVELPALAPGTVARIAAFMPDVANPRNPVTAPARCTRTRRSSRACSTAC